MTSRRLMVVLLILFTAIFIISTHRSSSSTTLSVPSTEGGEGFTTTQAAILAASPVNISGLGMRQCTGLTCPANVTQSSDPSQCGAVVNYPPPTPGGTGCGTVICIPPAGSFFPVGTTTVNCSITSATNKVSATPIAGGCPTLITHSTSQVITPGNSISCNNEFGHAENSYWRAFNLPSFSITTPFAVQSVDIGIQEAISGGVVQQTKGTTLSRSTKSASAKAPNGAGQPLSVRLYLNTDGAFPNGTRYLLASADFTISDQSGTILNLPISATVPAGAELVVEIFTPDGQMSGNLFFIGSNAAAETGPSYLSAPDCGVTIPTTTTDLGFPEMHIVMNVNGCEAPAGSSCSFTVTVQDTQAPTITCPENFTQGTDPNQCSAVVEYTPPQITDECPCGGNRKGLQSPNGGTCSVTCVPPPGATFPAGTTTVTCMATDAGGNQSAPCTFTVTITDTQPPVITCPPNQTAPSSGGSITVNYPPPTVTDNCPLSCKNKVATPLGECPPGSVSCTPPSGSTFVVGTTTVTCTACDCAGNSASCSFTVTVEPCMITCPANLTQSNDPNQCGAAVSFAPSATAGCGTVTCSPASGSFFPVGTTTVTCTTAAGPSCAFTVTVNDTQAPSITCPINVTAVTPPVCPASSTAVVTYPAPKASDNCPGVTVACVPPSGSSFPIGTTTVTCTATDASGNTATCSFTVKTFNVCVQDRSNPAAVLAWNTMTGEYVFCCNGTTFTGVGKVKTTGCTYTLDHTAADRRVVGRVDFTTFRGEGNLQTPAGTPRCTISDNDIRNNNCACIGGGQQSR